MPSPLVPIAISSQLDVTGEERLHAAKQTLAARPVWVSPGTSGATVHAEHYRVFELETGWSFDGYYIPHMLELNWYFGDDPVDYSNIQKLRVHGLSKGRTFLQFSSNGMQTDYIADYSTPEYMDLPAHPTNITSEFQPVTNYVSNENRGLSIQMKFEGRNTDITKPEPAHVLQVLVIQSLPTGTGARAN